MRSQSGEFPDENDPASSTPSGRRTPAAGGDSVEGVLQLAIDLHGPALLKQPSRLSSILADQCPEAAFDIALLMTALAQQVPQRLIAVKSGFEVKALMTRLEQELIDQHAMNPFAATWAVETWAGSVRMDSVALSTQVDPPFAETLDRYVAEPEPGERRNTLIDSVFGEPAELVSAPVRPRPVVPAAATVAPRITKPEPAPASHPAALHVVGGRVAVPFARSPAPVPSPIPAATLVPVVTPIRPPESAPVAREPVVSEPVLSLPVALEASVFEAALPEPIVVEDIAPEPIAEAASPEPIVAKVEPAAAIEVPVVAATPVLDPVAIAVDRITPSLADPIPPPPWAAPNATVAQGFNPWFGVAGVAAAIVVLIVAIRFVATREPAAPAAPPTDVVATAPVVAETRPAPAAIAAPEPEAAATPVAPLPAAPAPIATVPAAPVPPAAPRIVDVVSADPLIGDGRTHAVIASIDTSRDDLRSIEVSFVDGAGAWDPKPRIVAIGSDALRDGKVEVGTIGLRTTEAATATFQYILVAADGSRSDPFVKRFAFAPIAPAAPTIARIVVPAHLVVGKPFELTIAYRDGDGRLASVERKVVAAGEAAALVDRTTPMSQLTVSKDAVRYPVDAIGVASRSTLAFTLVDADGLRSAPKEVVLDIVARPAEPAAAACSAATCGVVAAVREIAPAGRTDPKKGRSSEVIVRLDDRSIHTETVPGSWKVGTRARLVDGRLVTSGARDKESPPRAIPPRVPERPGRLLPESVPIVGQ